MCRYLCTVNTAYQSGLLTVTTHNHGGCSENPCRYIIASCSPASYRLSSRRLLVTGYWLLAMSREGRGASGKPYLLTLQSTLLFSSKLYLHNPDLPPDSSPDCPSVKVGLVPVPVWLPWVAPARVLPSIPQAFVYLQQGRPGPRVFPAGRPSRCYGPF